MLDIPSDLVSKINNPLQLPSNQGDPRCILLVSGEFEAIDFSDSLKSGTVNSKYEDYAYSCNLTLIKGNETLDHESHFRPGAKIIIRATYGNSQNYIPLFYGFVDEINWDEDGETFSISATSIISHFLKECTMGEINTLTGFSHVVGAAIMNQAGVDSDNYFCTLGNYEWTYTYKPSDTCLSALEQMYPIFPAGGEERDEPGFGIMESPSGHVVFGYYRDRINPSYGGVMPGEITINIGSDCFALSTRMSIDKCYSKVRATGKAADGVDLKPVTINIRNFLDWSSYIPINKIYHANFNGYTMQENLEDWAGTIASELAFQGKTRDFTGPFRPHITVGDIARMVFSNTGETGVITSITHHIGMDGFKTEFTVDSGGVQNARTGWSSNMKANGYNRRQKLADIVHEIAEETTDEALLYHDPISIENMYDQEEEKVIDLVTHRNELKIAYDIRNYQDMNPEDEDEGDDDEDPEDPGS